MAKFQVVQVLRNENAKLWRDYVRTRSRIAEECARREDWIPYDVETRLDHAGAELASAFKADQIVIQIMYVSQL